MTTDQEPETEVRLWTPQGFREDEWTHAESADALVGNGRFILPLQVFLDLDPQERELAKERLGVLLQPGDQLEAIAGLFDTLSLVALAFPAFTDGRSYSKAELLRSRHGFEGAVRAVGQVLVDQLPHMLRVGFSEFEISNPVLLKRLASGDVGGLPLHYQPAAKPAAAGGKYSWRRTPGA
ncbi:hypothetical protein ASD64_10755 [Mesorhizobium sp. Root157]|uniref:DUF934 domain-containing protein n=1 Tax=Mesorhizobium sp. Root157 TaxID=1736477 RepID=UPI0006FB1ABB|nr:DUF934 domain-containing protein [Mesorhizobium sp. Root157]KQZ80787.1 hypothetical protein ASD64_10755 [Mesorhizobium sp. Root157]